MPHVSLSHLIGTISLLGILLIVGFIATSIDMDLKARTMKADLQDVAEFVGNELMGMTTLTESSQKGDLFSYKFISIPESIGTMGYHVSIVSDPSTGYQVVASLDASPLTRASAALHFRSGIVVGNATNVPPLDHSPAVQIVDSLGSGVAKAVVWCYYNATTQLSWVGLGVLTG